jgi:hypothetical protein
MIISHLALRAFGAKWSKVLAPKPAHNTQLLLGFYILITLGFRSARIRSLRSTTLRLAYARRNVRSW